jgi:rRNA maturation endonuclease Nob1
MVRIVCRGCLRLWDARRVAERSTCPFCGGALADH